jgi:hypothetical protein
MISVLVLRAGGHRNEFSSRYTSFHCNFKYVTDYYYYYYYYYYLLSVCSILDTRLQDKIVNIKIINAVLLKCGNNKYLGTTGINQNCNHEEIKNRLHSINGCFHPVQDLPV